MIRTSHNGKIYPSIVLSVSRNVMHDLFRLQVASEMSLRDEAMFRDIRVRTGCDEHHHVTIATEVLAELQCIATGARAVLRHTEAGAGRGYQKVRTANAANVGNPPTLRHVVTGFRTEAPVPFRDF